MLGDDTGFGVDTNRVLLLSSAGVVEEMLMQLQKTYMVKVHTDIFYEAGTLSPEQEHRLLRIAQGARANACSHGQAHDI